ncbi:MAG: hypothetical protein KJO77_08910 [Bacteroidia bacterium]|nr:hypothetical protein [Bacteroidia bacterium]NND52040.1 hypothetical protein [Flavobacteriaceae bacterium]
MKTLFILITTCFTGIMNFSGIETADLQRNCNSELSVEKNRSFKSADQDGTSFALVLENNSESTKTYNLSVKNLSTSCSNKASDLNKAASQNVNLDVLVLANDTFMTESNTVILGSGESLKFNVNVRVPDGTPFKTWSCIEVKAASEQCGSDSLKTILSVYVPNPSEG